MVDEKIRDGGDEFIARSAVHVPIVHVFFAIQQDLVSDHECVVTGLEPQLPGVSCRIRQFVDAVDSESPDLGLIQQCQR